MKRTALLLIAAATLAVGIACMIPASGQGNMTMAPGPGQAVKNPANAVYVTQIPPGYRDWRLISVAHEEGTLHSFAAMLGNDVAIKAYRDGKLPYPDGTIIAALHYSHTPSAENNKVFGDAQSFVPGPSTTSSSRSRTRRSMRRQVAGGSDVSAPTASQAPRPR